MGGVEGLGMCGGMHGRKNSSGRKGEGGGVHLCVRLGIG